MIKEDVLFILSKHPNKWLKAKSIAREMNLNTKEGTNRISNILYRLRNSSHIERKSCSHAYQYRYCEEINGYPTLENPFSKIERCEKGIDGGYEGYTDVELLPELEEGYCELCGEFKEIRYRGEKDGHIVFLCEMHGREVDKFLFSGNGRFEQ